MKQNSADVVLSLWELLEPILLYLDMLTLLFSQRVSHRWRSVIKKSKAIQQALFFIPIKPTSVPRHARIRNPLLEKIFWPRFVNPEWQFPDLDVRARFYSKRKISFRRESASWRRMLIQQPPTSVIGIVELDSYQFWATEDIHHNQILARPQGKCLRIGALYKALTMGVLDPYRETWILFSGVPQNWQEVILKDDYAQIRDVALKECDIVIFTWYANHLILGGRGAGVKKEPLELWLDELLVNSRKYKPRRSGGVNSKYYRCGYSKMS